MIIQLHGGDEFLQEYPRDNEKIRNLPEFYQKTGSLPLSEQKSIIALFRKMITYDITVEEILVVQKKLDPKPEEEKKNEEMEIEGFEDLPKLFISPIENFMDEFAGHVKDLRGLFKVPSENNLEGN